MRHVSTSRSPRNDRQNRFTEQSEVEEMAKHKKSKRKNAPDTQEVPMSGGAGDTEWTVHPRS